MTIKTISQAIKADEWKLTGDMKTKREAVKRNLFNTEPDRDEIHRLTQMVNDEGNRKLQSYKCEKDPIGFFFRTEVDSESSTSGNQIRLPCPQDSGSSDDGAGSTSDEQPSSSDSTSASLPLPSDKSTSDKARNLLMQPRLPPTTGQRMMTGKLKIYLSLSNFI